jgi:hypothetical protein
MVHGEVGQIVVRTSKVASREPVARRNRRKSGGMIAALAAVCLFASSTARISLAYADEIPAPTHSAETPALPVEAWTPPVPAYPALPPPGNHALDLGAPVPAPAEPSIFQRWWFWTAVGAAAAATVVIIVVSSRGHAPPATDLGNQEFQP